MTHADSGKRDTAGGHGEVFTIVLLTYHQLLHSNTPHFVRFEVLTAVTTDIAEVSENTAASIVR
jgi:hypothetical protein